jgi:cellulose biosynthesis protein BcsQ
MIITVVYEKGGVQPPVFAHNLAVLRAVDGHAVMLLDTHPQKRSYIWSQTRNATDIRPQLPAQFVNGRAVQQTLMDLMPHYSDVVIDTDGRDSQASRLALSAACVALVPIFPFFMTQAGQERLVARIQTARQAHPDLRILFVLAGIRNEPTYAFMTAVRGLVSRIPWASLADTVIHHTDALDGSYQQGLALCEYKPADGLAIGEMSSLYREIYKKYQRPSHMHTHPAYLRAA